MPKSPDNDAITDLLTGQLSPLAAWRLRRRIARSPELKRELAETQSLIADLQAFRSERPLRFPPDWSRAGSADMPARKTFAMNKPAVFAATAALCLLLVTGGSAAVRYLFPPLSGLDAGNGATWSADLDFRGEAKFRDAKGVDRGTVSFDGGSTSVEFDPQGSPTGTPKTMVRTNPVSAQIKIGSETFPVSGAGRHELRTPSGVLLGTVELVPQSKGGREAWRKKYDAQNGIVEKLHCSYGARDGFGRAIGYFGDGDKRVTWEVWGENVTVQFFSVATGNRVYQAQSFPVDDAVRAEQKRELSPEIYAATVADTLPPAPTFTYRRGSEPARTAKMGEVITVQIPDGTVLRVRLVTVDSRGR